MKNNFHDYKFSELYDINSGISSTKEQAGHGAPFVTFSDVFNNYFLPDTLSQKMDTSVKEQEKCSVKEGDIFLTRTSETLDELAMSSVAVKNYPHATFSGFLKRLRPKKKNVTYAKYMAFYLRGQYFRKIIDNNATMTLRASFNEDIFSWLYLLLPSYNEQKKIGDWLFSIEQKMQLNNKMNATLEAMAKTLYDYWFVQFDFPDEHGRPYKTSGGSMTYNEELGREIPTGWEVIPLKSIADYNNSLKEVVLSENYIGIDNMLPNMKGVTPSTYDVPAGSIIGFEKRDILIGNIRPYFKKIWLADFNGGCSPDVLVLHANIDSLTEFVYSSLANDTFFDYDTKGAKGTKMPRGDKAHIMSFPIAFNQKLAKKFSGIVQNMFIKKGQNVVENCYLTQLRDFLLPLLMNGQVTFK